MKNVLFLSVFAACLLLFSGFVDSPRWTKPLEVSAAESSVSSESGSSSPGEASDSEEEFPKSMSFLEYIFVMIVMVLIIIFAFGGF